MFMLTIQWSLLYLYSETEFLDHENWELCIKAAVITWLIQYFLQNPEIKADSLHLQ